MTRTPMLPNPGRLLWAAVLLPAACLAGGCVGGPQPAADGIPVRRLPAEVFGRPKSDLQPVPLPLLRQQEPDAYRVDRGDVLTVFAEDVLGVRDQIPVQQNPHPGAPTPAAQGYPVTVQGDGTIQLPEVPPISVRGKTLTEVREAIVKAITVDKELIVPGKERVTVDLLKKRTYRVLVVREDGPPSAACGDGKTGGGATLMLEAYHNDLLEALTRTGGLPGPCGRAEVVIRRGPNAPDPAKLTVRVPTRVCPADPVPFTDADIVLHDGDTVYVPARGEETYTVLGGPGCGQHPLPRDTDLRVVEALAKATCPTPACGWVTVLRKVGCNRQVPIRVDLADALRDPRENVIVLPGDVIVLPGCGPQKHAKDGCALGSCCAKRFTLPGWLSPIGPRPWPILEGDDCVTCP